jgi:hypothetical protein
MHTDGPSISIDSGATIPDGNGDSLGVQKGSTLKLNFGQSASSAASTTSMR